MSEEDASGDVSIRDKLNTIFRAYACGGYAVAFPFHKHSHHHSSCTSATYSQRCGDASQPPSTSTVVPVTNEFSVTKRTAFATSSGAPARGIKCVAVAAAGGPAAVQTSIVCEMTLQVYSV